MSRRAVVLRLVAVAVSGIKIELCLDAYRYNTISGYFNYPLARPLSLKSMFWGNQLPSGSTPVVKTNVLGTYIALWLDPCR